MEEISHAVAALEKIWCQDAPQKWTIQDNGKDFSNIGFFYFILFY